jgi:rhodanese-related sulfurtransferase
MYIRPKFDRVLKQALWLLFLAIAMALVYNLFNPKRIALVGAWAPKILEGGVTAPPSYDQTIDAPVVNLSEAMAAFNSGQAIFLDARKKEDYQTGHIQEAMRCFLEEFDAEYPLVKDKLPKEALIITYCGGDECELSLFLARNLKLEGYTNVKIFFGGWEEWIEAGLPVTTGEDP